MEVNKAGRRHDRDGFRLAFFLKHIWSWDCFSSEQANIQIWTDPPRSVNLVWVAYGLESSCRDIQKTIQNFTTTPGQGSFGPVYEAVMPNEKISCIKRFRPLIQVKGRERVLMPNEGLAAAKSSCIDGINNQAVAFT